MSALAPEHHVFDPASQTYERAPKPKEKPMEKTGVQRVTSVLLDQMPKLNQACDEVAATAQASILRAAKVISDISADFRELDAAVAELEALRAARTNGPEVPDQAPPPPSPVSPAPVPEQN